jgi:predicted component of type VI protein secretion system
MPALEFITGAMEGRRSEFESRTVIGSSADCGVRLTDNGISRSHARITVDAESASVEDLGSANGTYVNFRRLKSHETTTLNDRDVLFCGRTVMKFFRDGGAASGGGAVSTSELGELLRGTVPLEGLQGPSAEAAALRARRTEQREVLRRLGAHRWSSAELESLLRRARAT